jgi:hypothetical protein
MDVGPSCGFFFFFFSFFVRCFCWGTTTSLLILGYKGLVSKYILLDIIIPH